MVMKVAEIKWIKITTDMFDNRKIKHLRRLPDGNNIVLIWVMLLTMAGRCNSSGMIFLTENIPYTPKMLADELDFEENTVQLALKALEQLNMIVTDNGFFSIAGWDEYQNIEGMERIREQNRIRQKKWYDKQKELPNVRNNVSVTQSNATDIDIEEDKELEERNNTVSNDTVCRTDVQRIVDSWNTLGVSKVTKLVPGKTRDKLLKARIKEYGVDSIIQAIEAVRRSDFLIGKNKDGWTITFDWFIKPNNFPKVLDGNYDNKTAQPVNSYRRTEIVPAWLDESKASEMAKYVQKQKKDAESPEFKERVEALKKMLSEKYKKPDT